METGVLRILSPTDSVTERQIAFKRWQDRQGLEQALLVGKAHPIDLRAIRTYSKKGEKSSEFEEFKQLLET